MKNLLLLILLVSSLYSQENKKIVLQLSWLHQFQFAGYYIAKEKGYYKDYNIDLEIKEFNFDIDISKVLQNKTADFAIGRSSLLIEKSNGDDVVALFATFQNSPLMLLVREDSNIKTIADLKNKKVMITPDAKDSASIIAMLNSQKISLDDINIVKHSFNLDDLVNKKVDAMASYVSNEPIRLEDQGIKYKVFHPKDYGFELYSDILFTSSQFMKNNPQLTQDFYDATEKGWEYAFNNIGKTAQIIYEKYNSQNKSLVHLVAEGEALKKLVFHKNSNNIGCLDKNKLQRITDIYKIMGLINKDINLDGFVYDYNKHDSFNLHFTHNETWIYSLFAIIMLLMMFGAMFYFIITRKWLITKEQLKREILVKTNKLNKQTYTDYLTKAKNKKAYAEKIEEHLSLYKRYKTTFSMILFDIDNFKYINDTYGHTLGDTILKDLVKIVKKTIRQNDHLFRVGGEEFVIIFANTKLDEAKIVSEHIRKNIEENLSNLKNETITVSIGLCEVADDDNDNAIYTRADKLMYKSKENGKNKITY